MDDKIPTPRRNLVAGALTALGVAALALKSDKAKASIFGEENVTLAAILTQLKTTYDHAVKLKEEYYDKHLKKFNEQVKDINEGLKTAQDTYASIKGVENWMDYLRTERDYFNNFLKTFIQGKDNFMELRLRTYSTRVSALAKILASQKSIIDEIDDINEKMNGVDVDSLPEKERYKASTRKRLLAVISKSRHQSDEAEIRIDAINEREKDEIEKIRSSKMDQSGKLEVYDSMKLTAIKDLLEELVLLQTRTNDLLEANFRYSATKRVDSRHGEDIADERYSKNRIDSFEQGVWSHESPKKGK